MLSPLQELRKIRAEALAIVPLALPSAPGIPTKPTEAPLSEYCPAMADVLHVLIQAQRPVLHSHIVREMRTHGHSKAASYAAIATCQGSGWIAHNLVDGYEIP